jgi:putative aldouronate transport system substrate-binding protein
MDHYAWYSAVPPMTSPGNNEQVWPKAFPIQFGEAAITSRCKYPEALIRWLDEFYSAEGGAFANQGPEGLGWYWEDDKHTLWNKKPVPAGFSSTEEYRGTLTPACGTSTPYFVSESFGGGLNAPHILHLKESVTAVYKPCLKESFPIVKLTIAETKEAAVISMDIDKYMQQMEARFITGDAPLTGWDNYVRDLNNMKVARLVEIYQTAYNRFRGK